MPGTDPLQKLARPLAAVLISVVISTLIAAMIGGAMPLDYGGRAWVYTGFMCYVIAGAVVVFKLAAQGETQALTPARILKWTLSLWVWPALLLGQRR
jgi:membrane protease YdiL (CAAX protease family)